MNRPSHPGSIDLLHFKVLWGQACKICHICLFSNHKLDSEPVPSPTDSKLVFLIRHGQAISNYLSDFLGPDEWFKVEETCAYTQKDGTEWGLFDAGGGMVWCRVLW